MKYKILNSEYEKIICSIKIKFNLVLIDPPYNINYCEWDNPVDYEFLFSSIKNILKPNSLVIVFGGWSTISHTIEIGKKYFELHEWIAWDRIKGRGSKKKAGFNKRRYFNFQKRF